MNKLILSALVLSPPNGAGSFFQSHLGKSKVCAWLARGSGTTVLDPFGGLAPTAVGTATSRAVATTRFFTAVKRLGYVSAAGAGSAVDLYGATAQYFRGSSVTGKAGGFRFSALWGVSDAATVAGAITFVGMNSTAGAMTATTEISALTDCVGFGGLSTSSNMQFVYNDASGTASLIDLGSNFPINTLSVDWYRTVIDCDPAGTYIDAAIWRCNMMVDGSTVNQYFWQTRIETDLPTATTLLTPHLFRSNNATALAVGLDVSAVTVETNF